MDGTILNGFAVLDRLVLISGLEKSEARKYLSSCIFELARIKARVKETVSAEEYAEGIIAAAAAQVNCTVCAAAMMKNEGEFSVGDVSVKGGYKERRDAAERLRTEAFAAIADILTDRGFAFIKTGG